MRIVIPATQEDTAAIAAVLEEIDRYYGSTEQTPNDGREEQTKSLIFRDQPAANVLLAKDGAEVVGLAAYSFLWPAAGVTQSLFLKELYVLERHRRSGVGRLLMQEVFSVAAANGCSRVEWMADRDNRDAQRFYDSLGFTEEQGKIFYRAESGLIQPLPPADPNLQSA